MKERKRTRRALARRFAPWRVGPVFILLLLLLAGTVAIANAAARPIEVSLNSGDPWEFETDQDLITAGTPVFVATGGTGFTARVTIDTGGDGDDSWESTSYQFVDAGTLVGTATCINHANVTTDGSFFDFNLTAPAAAGVYGIRFIAYNTTDNCTSGEPRAVDVLTSVNVGGENPTADPGCGFSMGLIVDSSGSINDGGDQDEQAVFDAVIALLTQLEGTGVEISLIDFDTNASVIVQPTVVDAALVADVNANWDYDADGFTNWEDAFQTQRTDLNDYNSGPEGEPSSVPDFILFFTDGAPTVRIGETGSVSNSDGLNLTLAVDEANLLKAAGARIVGIGVGGVTQDVANVNRLKAVSGPVEAVGTPDPLTDDVIITDFDSLGDGFQELALSLCGSSLTITKEVPDGQGGWEPAQGWEFTADVSMTTGGANDYEWELPDPNATAGDPVAGTTNANGTITYQWQPDNPPADASVDVEETIQAGYAMQSVDCEETRLDGNEFDVTVNNLDLDAGTFDIDLTNGSIGVCIVRNIPVPEFSVTKTADPTTIASGDSVVYTVRIDNDGPGSITIDTLTDDQFNDITTTGHDGITATTCDVTPPVVIAEGGFYECTFTATVTGNPNTTHTNIVTACDTSFNPDQCEEGTEDVDILEDPEIDVTKSANPTSVPATGGPVVYTVRIDNTGGGAVTIDTLVDDIFNDITTTGHDGITATTCDVTPPVVIAEGGFYECTFTATVSGTAGTTHTNEVTASGTGFNGDPVSDSDTADVNLLGAGEIEVAKSANPTSVPATGGSVVYTVRIDNTGDGPVEIDTLNDDMFGDITTIQGDVTATTCDVTPPVVIAEGGFYQCTFTATVSGTAGTTHTNEVTASGTDQNDDPVSDTDTADVALLGMGTIDVTKSANPTEITAPSASVIFTVRIDNTGDGPVEIDTLTDDMFGDITTVQGDVTATTCDVTPPVVIPEGGFYQCTFTATVSGTPGDTHTNEVTGSGTDQNDDPVSDTDTADVYIRGNPAIDVDKSANPTQVVAPGGLVTFTIEVENIGDEPLVNIDLEDDMFGDLLDPGNPNVINNTCPAAVEDPLAPGDSFTCTFQAQITGQPGGQHVNEAESCGDSTTIGDFRVCQDDTATVDIIGGGGGSCPTVGYGNTWTDILGIGMGQEKKHKLQAKLFIPNSSDLVTLYGQLAGKQQGLAKYVRFIYPNNTFVELNTQASPAPQQWGVFWYGTELDPAANVRGRWFLQKTGVKGHIPRAFILYPTYYDEGQTYVNVFETIDTSDSQVYWDILEGWTPSRQLTIDIPAPQAPVTFNVELALVDNDLDNRPIFVTVTAGGVSQTLSPTSPNRGNLLNILTFTLANVPAGTDEIVIDIFSPDPFTYELGAKGGDSGAITGVTANYECEVGGG